MLAFPGVHAAGYAYVLDAGWLREERVQVAEVGAVGLPVLKPEGGGEGGRWGQWVSARSSVGSGDFGLASGAGGVQYFSHSPYQARVLLPAEVTAAHDVVQSHLIMGWTRGGFLRQYGPVCEDVLAPLVRFALLLLEHRPVLERLLQKPEGGNDVPRACRQEHVHICNKKRVSTKPTRGKGSRVQTIQTLPGYSQSKLLHPSDQHPRQRRFRCTHVGVWPAQTPYDLVIE